MPGGMANWLVLVLAVWLLCGLALGPQALFQGKGANGALYGQLQSLPVETPRLFRPAAQDEHDSADNNTGPDSGFVGQVAWLWLPGLVCSELLGPQWVASCARSFHIRPPLRAPPSV